MILFSTIENRDYSEKILCACRRNHNRGFFVLHVLTFIGITVIFLSLPLPLACPQVIPQNMFRILNDIIRALTFDMRALPMKLERLHLKEFAQVRVRVCACVDAVCQRLKNPKFIRALRNVRSCVKYLYSCSPRTKRTVIFLLFVFREQDMKIQCLFLLTRSLAHSHTHSLTRPPTHPPTYS